MEDELFAQAAQKTRQPLAARMAPKTLDEFAGQEDILGPGKMLRRLVESGKLSCALFFGPPGSGKTALARLIASRFKAKVAELNAVTAGVADLKKILEEARFRLKNQGEPTLLLVDEIHHFNRTQQDVLLPAAERGEILLIGLTTENPSFYVNAALMSRITAFEFAPLDEAALLKILNGAVVDSERGLGSLNVELKDEASAFLVRNCGGDARRLLNALELAAESTKPDGREKRVVTLSCAEESIRKRSIRYDKKSDDHYDHISAFIKSMRGSDPDAAVYWMAKMLAAGEDPRFIARRILICAAEDVGLADPRALSVALAAFQAAEVLGMPEARIPLCEAALYVATAPKSNAAYLAVDAALREVKNGPSREVPDHLKDSSLDAESRGHGQGYRYPHDFPGHYTPQEYLPKPVKFYEPTEEGAEAAIAQRLASLKSRKAP